MNGHIRQVKASCGSIYTPGRQVGDSPVFMDSTKVSDLVFFFSFLQKSSFWIKVGKLMGFEYYWNKFTLQSWKNHDFREKVKIIKFSNFEFYFKFWKKLDEYNQKTMFFSIFPTLRLFFQLCSNFYVLRIWKITISKPLMMESWNFHRLFSMIIYIDDLHFRNHSWKNDCTELEKV